ncbi:MAG: DUF192 domain-containing protein [Bacillota bacterium]
MLYNLSNDRIVAEHISIADSFFKRFKGLMGRKNMAKSEGLMLMSCNSIHTFFMRFPIDVVFLDMDYVVISIKECIKPWRLVNIVKKAYIVVELPEGAIEHKNISVGDRLIMK